MHPADHPARRRLSAALRNLAVTFRGMTAHPDENNCECHWGSAEELSLLKTPDVELEPDLLRRTWQATDWTDHAAVLRRILPQFAQVLVAGRAEPLFGDLEEAGYSFARGRWQQWPDHCAGTVREFLHAWWEDSLTDPDAVVPAHQVFVMCAEASGSVGPWLLGDSLPWSVGWYEHDEEEMRADLVAWLLGHAAVRLRESGASAELQHRIRLLGLADEDRWTDPHWPGHRY
jgi:hypothetical protein